MLGILLFILFILIAGGLTWYFWPKPLPDDDDGDGGDGGPPPDPDPSVDAETCTQFFNQDDTSGCVTDSTSGIQWKWSDSDGSAACKAKCVGYNLTVSSTWEPSNILQAYINDPNQIVAGIKGMPEKFYKGQINTFTIVPVDKDKKALIKRPVEVKVNHAEVGTDCSREGIEGNLKGPIPDWNLNNYYHTVNVKSKCGSANLHVWVHAKDGTTLVDSTGILKGYSKDFNVPKGGYIDIGIWYSGSNIVRFTYDNLKRCNITQLNPDCGWYGWGAHWNVKNLPPSSC